MNPAGERHGKKGGEKRSGRPLGGDLLCSCRPVKTAAHSSEGVPLPSRSRIRTYMAQSRCERAIFVENAAAVGLHRDPVPCHVDPTAPCKFARPTAFLESDSKVRGTEPPCACNGCGPTTAVWKLVRWLVFLGTHVQYRAQRVSIGRPQAYSPGGESQQKQYTTPAAS